MTPSDAVDLSMARNERATCNACAALFVGAGLGFGACDAGAAALVAAGCWGAFAMLAHIAQRRCDSIFARALAADLAEGVDDPTALSEAA